jgi:DnaJ-like protein
LAFKTYYDLLEIPPASSTEEVKRAFRLQIARYHPDKVQHLGKEFQAMAAERAAELTEAYRILSDEGRRAEYDRSIAADGGQAAAASRASAATQPAAPYVPPPPRPETEPSVPLGKQFTQERARRDEYVRTATVGRLRQALGSVGDYDETQVPGFDIACVPKSRLFGRSKNPRLLGRFVSTLDKDAIADAWTQASKWADAKKDDVCVLLLGTSLAPAGELAGEIANQRRKSRGAKLTVIPVDASVWNAHMPLDAPEIAKSLIARLKSGG